MRYYKSRVHDQVMMMSLPVERSTYDLIKGTPYPYNLSSHNVDSTCPKERLVIPFDHFINNDLEYLKGGSSSQKYTASITKTKVADYGQVKWIKDRIPRTTWSVSLEEDYGLSTGWMQAHPIQSYDVRYAINVALRCIAIMRIGAGQETGYMRIDELHMFSDGHNLTMFVNSQWILLIGIRWIYLQRDNGVLKTRGGGRKLKGDLRLLD
ncbi:hypothetical protein Tco_0389523 [Tanacetum coccineum]